MQEIKVYMTGWLNYYGIASLKTKMQEWDEWLRHRIRAYIWKQWKVPSARITQPHETGHTETLCLQMGICESLLECSWKPNSAKLYYKRETRTSRILQSIRQVRVPALMRLNRRIGNPSYGGVRGRGYRPLPTRLRKRFSGICSWTRRRMAGTF